MQCTHARLTDFVRSYIDLAIIIVLRIMFTPVLLYKLFIATVLKCILFKLYIHTRIGFTHMHAYIGPDEELIDSSFSLPLVAVGDCRRWSMSSRKPSSIRAVFSLVYVRECHPTYAVSAM